MTASPHLDWKEVLLITLSEDKMQAYLSFKQVENPIRMTDAELERFIASHGVKYGLRKDILQMICASPQDFYLSENIIAVGTEARNGADGFVKVLYDADSKDRRPLIREDGSADYKEIVKLANVKAGQLIAERYPPQPGIPGMNVAGEEIPAKDGKEANFKIGKNVVANAENTGLYAAIDGLVTKTDKDRLNVFPVYEVNGDVDYNIGNIDFVGTVVIRGNVLTGFKIRASGDIRVTGGIEGAEVESEGSIEVSGGIIGSNKGFVKAGRSVKCSFIQEGNVIAGEDVTVMQSIMHSNVRAGNSITCTGTKGLIVGGVMQAGERVAVRMLGNSMSTATAVEVGVRPELRQELVELRNSVRELTASLDKTDKALALLNQMAAVGQLSPDRMEMRSKLGATRRQTAEELQLAKEGILQIEKSLEDMTSARVDVTHTIFGGTKIVIGRYTRFVKDSIQRVSFRFFDGEINLVPYG
ncbi:FapA family protein [Cohnella lubricantis]|uniref:DUF342 domain-containing protein n=1 Tax=Cohnella lubricantis TaxID=2163172 RepID=A0A841TJI2_9BACL|nr:FapA family protein [Cohnella lubricantis]MBB6679388.1 DUF342 domain-containing protein [Cohnella lubricantis]MBP2117470.1 uncharacterized protein (DUF342 family) [Cohnella lubricantis]